MTICELSDCCIESIRRYTGPVEEGDYLDCEQCGKSVFYIDGAWEPSELTVL